MPDYNYIATDHLGQPQHGKLSAATQEAAMQQLQQQGWQVESLTEVLTQDMSPMSRSASDELAIQLAELTSSELPLEQGLRKLAEELHWSAGISKKSTRSVLLQLANKLESGASLETALEQVGAPPDLLAAIKAGLQTGTTSQVLTQYISYVKTLSTLRSRMFIGIAYPTLLFCISMAALLGLLVFIIPIFHEFSEIFDGFGIELPRLTSSLLFLTGFVMNYGAVMLTGVVIFIVIFLILLRVLPGTVCRRIQYMIPGYGGIMKSIALSRFTHSLGFLTENQVELPQAIRLSGQSTRDALLEQTAEKWACLLEHGEVVPRKSFSIREMPVELFDTLSRAGNPEVVGQSLHALGEMYEERARIHTATIIAFAEPIILILVGLFFVISTIALFYPLVRLLNNLSAY